MDQNRKRNLDLPLLLPLGLLIVEIIAIIVLLAIGIEITQYLLYFFIILGIYLLYQLSRQLLIRYRVARARNQQQEAAELAESGQPMEALKIWKKSLLQLPKDQYLETLALMESVYEEQEMIKGAQQIKAILEKSRMFFDTPRNFKEMTAEDRRNWQNEAFELRNMINKLPVQKGQDLSDL
jgi:hypothetical protein